MSLALGEEYKYGRTFDIMTLCNQLCQATWQHACMHTCFVACHKKDNVYTDPQPLSIRILHYSHCLVLIKLISKFDTYWHCFTTMVLLCCQYVIYSYNIYYIRHILHCSICMYISTNVYNFTKVDTDLSHLDFWLMSLDQLYSRRGTQ